MRLSMQRTFSPPESTLAGLYTSSPENSMRPKKPRRKVSAGSSLYWRSQSIRLPSNPSKNALLSFGKKLCEVETPHLKLPSSGCISPANICISAVWPASLSPTRAILSLRFMTKLTLSSTFTPSTVFESPSTNRMSLPASRSGEKPTKGYLRLDAGISSSVMESRIFLRLVACRDFDLLAENRWMKLCSSRIFSSFFLFWLRISC